MKFWRFAVLYLATAALAGCRSGGDVQLLEQENFQLTEVINQLEYQRDRLCRELQSCRGQLSACEQALTSCEDKQRRGRNGQDSTNDGFRPPEVDLGPANDPQPAPKPRLVPTPKDEPGSTRQDLPYNGLRGPDVTQLHQTAMASVRDQRVIRITLEPRETGGYDADAQPGDEGIIVVVEPRNAAGELVRVAGEIVIAAWDSQRLEQTMQQPDKRAAAHVGTWNFNAQDAATWFLADEPRMKFELLWPPAGRPQNRELNVYVQYMTDDGRQLQAETQIQIQHTGQRPKKRTVDSTVENSESPLLRPTNAVQSDGLASQLQDEQKRPALEGIRKKASASRTDRRPVWRPYR